MQYLESTLIKVLALKDLQKTPYNLIQWQFSLLTKSIIPNFRVLLAKRHLTHYLFCLFIIYCCCTLSLLNTLAEGGRLGYNFASGNFFSPMSVVQHFTQFNQATFQI